MVTISIAPSRASSEAKLSAPCVLASSRRALVVRIEHADELHPRVFAVLARMNAPEGACAKDACAQLAHSTVTDLARLRG